MQPRVSELEILRQDALSCIERVVDTLVWFSEHFQALGTIPRNIWRLLDRPLPPEDVGLAAAFALWHAALRAERALRNFRPRLAKKLADQARGIRDSLRSELNEKYPTAKNDLVVRLARDEIYGTFNAFSAAAVLRSEVFPYRSAVTPSYLAGHILVAELKVAQRRATSHSTDGIGDRAPRVAAVAQGVHSIMLYVEHLRARATHFRRIAEQLDELDSLTAASRTVLGLPAHEGSKLEDAIVRVALTIIAPSAEQCGLLLLSPRNFFDSLDVSCRQLLRRDQLDTKALLDAFIGAARTLKSDPATVLDQQTNEKMTVEEKQIAGFTFAFVFAYGLDNTIRQIESNLVAVFKCTNYGDLKDALGNLAVAANRLIRKHLGSHDYVDAPPSIADSARFGFVEDLITTFSEVPFRRWMREMQSRRNLRLTRKWQAKEVKLTEARTRRGFQHRAKARAAKGHSSRQNRRSPSREAARLTFRSARDPKLFHGLKDLYRRYGLAEHESKDPCELVRELGKASIGRSVLNWWASQRESYHTSLTPESIKEIIACSSIIREPAECAPTGEDADWLTLRHRSFVATARFNKRLEQCATLNAFSGTLRDTAQQYEHSADQVQKLLRRLAQWCQSRGRDLLLSAETGYGPVDPNELVSAMWVADRLGEPWPERLELEALRIIETLQQANGGFASAEPLYQNRGFLYYPSSAHTLAALARFVTRGGADNGDSLMRGRLQRWEKILAGGARFLSNRLVGGNRGLAGWQTDRHPETDRIDCLDTCESVTALCRAIDGFTSLLSVEACADFSVTWPKDRVSSVIPSDCASGKDQILPKLMAIVRDLRQRTGRYTPLWETSSTARLTRRSLLFYGPPGTGKTYFQQLIAGELGWPLVVLTVGDFLADGEDKVGARTVQILKQLTHISNACIVFDEFDEMVIRRSNRVGHSAFDLLTPTMLPLLADLRTHAETHNCLVTFTTNYVERLDRAAKRVGRVDEEIPLIYHDFTSRLLMLLKTLIASGAKLEWQTIESVIAESGLCSYPELRTWIDQAADPSSNPLATPRQAIEADFYLERLHESNDKQVMREAELVIRSIGKDEHIPKFQDWIQVYARVKEKSGNVVQAKRA